MELPEYGSAWNVLKAGEQDVLEAMAYDWCQRLRRSILVMNVFMRTMRLSAIISGRRQGPAYVLNLDPKETY